jgi:hypothetical protein
MSNWPNYIPARGAACVEKKNAKVNFPFGVISLIYGALAHGDPKHRPEQEHLAIPVRTYYDDGRRWQATVVPMENKKGEEVLAVLVAAVPVAGVNKREQRWLLPVDRLRGIKFNLGFVLLPAEGEAEEEQEAPEQPTEEATE